MSHLYNIFHIYDTDGGFGDAVEKKDFIACVEATEEEIDEFLEKWDKPRIYDHPYADLREHEVIAKRVDIMDLSDVQPYNPRTRDWPDLPPDRFYFSEYVNGKWTDEGDDEDENDGYEPSGERGIEDDNQKTDNLSVPADGIRIKCLGIRNVHTVD